jgi:hypothetical protein
VNCASTETPSRGLYLLAGVALAALAGAFAPTHAHALSEIQREDVPVPEEPETGAGEIEREDLPPPPVADDAQRERRGPATPSAGMPVPLPDPIVTPKTPEPPAAEESGTESDEPIPEILYDVALLPEPVRRLRALIMEACLSGEIERLRPLLSSGEDATQLSVGDAPGDPIQFLLDVSGDGEGHEILAILYEVLAAGFVRLDEEETGEMYVWPYFFAVPLDKLDGRQRVELFKLVTAGDYEDMRNYGAYIFYRAGISAEGRWLFFVAGD